MTEKILVTISETHSDWLEKAREKKGARTKQDVIRDLISTAYIQDKGE